MTKPYAIVVTTVYGQMIVNRHDTIQTPHILKTGKPLDFPHIEGIKERLCWQKGTILDIGANFGTWSLGLSSLPGTTIIAFEPQRQIFNMLCGTIALAGAENVMPMRAAVGDQYCQVEAPRYDMNKPMNFGGVELIEQREPLGEDRLDAIEMITVFPIDSVPIKGPVIFMKIDVEGMETKVLAGAKQTILEHKPLLYIEHLKSNKRELGMAIELMGYKLTDTGMDYFCEPR